MSDETTDDGLRARLGRQGEETLGRIAQELLENPLVSGALARTFEARERAAQAQEAAMGALNLPSASDLERLTRRVRSVGQRLEGIEDGMDRLADRLSGGGSAADAARLEALEQRLASLDDALAKIAASVAALERARRRRAAPRRPPRRRSRRRRARRRRASPPPRSPTAPAGRSGRAAARRPRAPRRPDAPRRRRGRR